MRPLDFLILALLIGIGVRAKEETVHVGLSFLIDADFQKDEENTFGYLAAFTKAVHMRFLSFKKPAVKVGLAKVRPLTKSEVDEIAVLKESFLDGKNTLSNLAAYIKNKSGILTDGKTRFHWKDICDNCVAVFITRMKIADEQGDDVTGMSYYDGACGPFRAAIFHDDGQSFSGVNAAARQVERLLGVYYDGRGPLKRKCTPPDEYIVTDQAMMIKHSGLSTCGCSTRRFIYGLPKDDRWSCLTKEVQESSSAGLSNHPYDFLTKSSRKKNYCYALTQGRMTKSCEVNQIPTGSCKLLCCGEHNIIMEVQAPDGMSCDSGKKMCVNGECSLRMPVKPPR